MPICITINDQKQLIVNVNMVFVGTTRIAEMNFGFVRGLTEGLARSIPW